MTLEVLISTIDDGIYCIPELILPQRENVSYLVSWQVDDVLMYRQVMQMSCFSRQDVRLFTIKGRGLSRNRNNCLMRAEGDILLICDDDCKYKNDYFDKILTAYNNNDADVIMFKSTLSKSYPSIEMKFSKAMRHKGYYPSSVEMTMRRRVAEKIRFNEDFGLGSGKYVCGEEDVFLKDAQKAGFYVAFVPKEIVDTPTHTTGNHFLDSYEIQKTKGAVFRYVYPRWEAQYRILKEVLHYWIYNKVNPLLIYRNMTSE